VSVELEDTGLVKEYEKNDVKENYYFLCG